MSLLRKKRLRFLATAASVLGLVVSLVVFAPAARAGVCEGALSACLIDAGLTALHNPVAGLIYAMFCMDGYGFCIHYYPEA